MSGVIIILVIGLMVLLAWFPGYNAKRRKHKNAQAINVAAWLWCLVSLGGTQSEFPETMTSVLSFAWIGLVVWSYTGGDQVGKVTGRGFEPIINDGAGRYVVVGVDRETKMDTTWRVEASNRANAQVKAELEGIIVTSIEREA